MKRMIAVLICVGLSIGAGENWAGQQEVVESIGNGEINWSTAIIMAKGSGAPPKEAKNIAQARLMTERAALADARRNLLEVLKGVRVDSTTFVENSMVKSDEIRLKAEGFIQGSAEVRKLRRYLSDGAVEVAVAISLKGDLMDLLLSLPKELPAAKPLVPERLPPPLPPLASEKKAEPLPPAPPVTKTEPAPPEPKPLLSLADLPNFTGLVIDTRGLNMRAALVPKILDEQGHEIYQGQYVPRNSAAQNGLALYSKDLTAAQTNPRVGKNPLTVKGFKVDPRSPSDVILGAEDVKQVAPFAQKGTFLEECKVMIVLD